MPMGSMCCEKRCATISVSGGVRPEKYRLSAQARCVCVCLPTTGTLIPISRRAVLHLLGSVLTTRLKHHGDLIPPWRMHREKANSGVLQMPYATARAEAPKDSITSARARMDGNPHPSKHSAITLGWRLSKGLFNVRHPDAYLARVRPFVRVLAKQAQSHYNPLGVGGLFKTENHLLMPFWSEPVFRSCLGQKQSASAQTM